MTDAGPALPWQWVGAGVAGMNITILCKNILFLGCPVQHTFFIKRIICWSDL